MLAKRQNSYESDSGKSPNPSHITSTHPIAELNQVRGSEALAPLGESVARVNDKVISVDFANLVKSPANNYSLDYEEFFPTTEIEATEAMGSLTPELVNRRCYWLKYWPSNQVFRIKDVDLENNTVYLNIIYRWVSATNITLLKGKTPKRSPKDIEVAYMEASLAQTEKECEEF